MRSNGRFSIFIMSFVFIFSLFFAGYNGEYHYQRICELFCLVRMWEIRDLSFVFFFLVLSARQWVNGLHYTIIIVRESVWSLPFFCNIHCFKQISLVFFFVSRVFSVGRRRIIISVLFFFFISDLRNPVVPMTQHVCSQVRLLREQQKKSWAFNHFFQRRQS